jgi:hypothetical protein
MEHRTTKLLFKEWREREALNAALLHWRYTFGSLRLRLSGKEYQKLHDRHAEVINTFFLD